MRYAIAFLLLGACATGYSEADVQHLEERVGDANTRRMAAALDHALSAKGLHEVPAPVADAAVVRMKWATGEPFDLQGDAYSYGYGSTLPGLVSQEQVGTEVLPDGSVGRTVLVIAPQCGGGCECHAGTAYHFASDDAGRLWLVRLHVQWQYRTVHRSGSCGFGCGVPMPEEPASIYGLPDGLAGFVDENVVQEEVDMQCDHMIPAP